MTRNPEVQTGEPARQGFYQVVLAGKADQFIVAEWREYSKKTGKRWWHHVSDDPTVEKKPVPLDDVAGYAPVSKEAVANALRRELTVDEKIEAAYEARVSRNSLYPHFFLEVPERRRVKVGDKLILGNLKDLEVVAVRDAGQIVVYQYHDLRQAYGQEVDGGIKYQANHWTELLPLHANTLSGTQYTREPTMYGGYLNSTLSSLISRVRQGLDDSPDYQRGYVWTAADKNRYLDTLFNGRELGRFLFVNNRYPQRMSILDGKQRLACLFEFFTGSLAYDGIYYDELSRLDQHRVSERSVQFADLPGERYSRIDLLNIFLEVNAAGVPQTPEHLDDVRRLLKVELAREVLRGLDARAKVSSLYDDSEELRSALQTLIPDFEYPDYSHKTVGELRKRFSPERASGAGSEKTQN